MNRCCQLQNPVRVFIVESESSLKQIAKGAEKCNSFMTGQMVLAWLRSSLQSDACNSTLHLGRVYYENGTGDDFVVFGSGGRGAANGGENL